MADCEHVTHPEHWPGDAGAVIDAHSPDDDVRISNDAMRQTVKVIGEAIGIALTAPTVTAEDVREWLIAEPFRAVSMRQYPDSYAYVSQLP